MNEEIQMEMRPKVRYWVPAACMQEEDLRLEIRQLCARGFGGVEIVSLGAQNLEIDRSEYGWGHERWEKYIDIIADETKKQGMTMDLANGPGWPIAMPAVTNADHPASLRELTYGADLVRSEEGYHGLLPERRKIRAEGTPHLVAACAYCVVGKKTLLSASYVDLLPFVSDGRLDYDFSESGKIWIVFAFYEQPSGQKVNAGQQYVIDHLSKEGSAACISYWEEQLSRHTYEAMESIFCDSLEYEVTMEWTPDLPKEFLKRRGYDILPFLPVVGSARTYPANEIPGYQFENIKISEMINRDYLETITELYCEYHLDELRKFADSKGVDIRCQVAYNKPFDEERCGLYVQIPENEALGRSAMDGLKTMAAAVHLGRKKRYSFECAAEFGHSYGQSYEDLFWWVKRSLMSGCNSQVLHGASYSGRYEGVYAVNGYLPQVQWPGFECFFKAVSNYWNRTPSIEDARGCMDAVARLNTIFRKQAKVDCLIYRSSYVNDGAEGEYAHFNDGGMLSSHGYSYEFASEALLQLPVCTVKDGMLDAEGVAYRSLIIPEMHYISASFARKATELMDSGFPVLAVGDRPQEPEFYSEYTTKEKRTEWERAVEEAWIHPGMIHVRNITEVVSALQKHTINSRIRLDGHKTMITATRAEGECIYYILYANNAIEYTPETPNPEEMSVSAVFRQGTTKGSYKRPGIPSRQKVEVILEGCGRVQEYNPWTGMYSNTSFYKKGNDMAGSIEMEEDEMKIFRLDIEALPETNLCTEPACEDLCAEDKCDITWRTLTLYSFEPDTPEEKSFLRSRFAEKGKVYDLGCLMSWKDMNDTLIHFCGKGIYKGTIALKEYDRTADYVLELGQVDDTFSVKINGKRSCFPDQVMKRVEIGSLLHAGENSIEVTVVSNLYNRFFYEGYEFMGIPFPYVPRAYGMYETDNKKIRLLKQA